MRIYRRSEFMTLPAGIIYCKGKPWHFDGLCIKGETIVHGDGMAGDWCYCNPAWVDAHDSGEAAYRLEEMLATGASWPCEKDDSRDGCFDEDDIFLIFEAGDLMWLEERIKDAIGLATKKAIIHLTNPTSSVSYRSSTLGTDLENYAAKDPGQEHDQ